MQHWTMKLVQVCGLLLCLEVSGSHSLPCHCARSNSTYLLVPVTTRPPGTNTPGVTTAVPGGAAATSTPPGEALTTPGSSHSGASTIPPRGPGYTAADNATLLSLVLDNKAFNQSSPGFTYNASSNQFTVPRTGVEERIVIDLQVGPTGAVCRPMPYIEQICVSSQCDGCNLNEFTAAALPSLGDTLTQRIFYPTPVVSKTVCAGRDAFEDFGNFRYIVFLPTESAAPSSPYAFRVSLSGNFSSYSCSSRRRRSLLNDAPVGSVDADVDSFFRLLSRNRRAVPDDCSCPVGQDPVFSSVRTVLVSWEFPLKPFNASLSDTSSAEYVALARESYYLLMDAVRNASVSNLTSVVADFFDIVFSSVDNGTRLTAKLTVRNDSFYSDSFLQQELRAIIPGYGFSVVNLTVAPLPPEVTTAAPTTAATTVASTEAPYVFPPYAIALICVLGAAAIAATMGGVWWYRHHQMELLNPPIRFYPDEAPAEFSSLTQPQGNTNSAAFRLDGEILQPNTANPLAFRGQ